MLSIAILLCFPFAQYGRPQQTKLQTTTENNPDKQQSLLDSAEVLLKTNIDSAKIYLDSINQSRLKIDQTINYNRLKGSYFKRSLKLDSAVKYFTQALVGLEVHEAPSIEADVNDQIGFTYIDLRDSEKAFMYFNEANEIRKNNQLNDELSKSYYAQGNIHFRLRDIGKAVTSYKKGIETIDGGSNISLLANLNYMLGNSYNMLSDVDSALYFFRRAKELYDNIGPDQSRVLVSNEIALALIFQNKFSEAIPILEENLITIQSFKDWQYYNRTYRLLVDAYEGTGDYMNALKYQKQKFDTVMNFLVSQRTESVAQITEDHRTDKQLDQAEEQAFFATRRAKIFGTALAILAVVLIISYLLFSRAIQKKKLENLQAMVLGEENERKRVAKDLHDGIGVLLTSVKLRLSNFQDKVESKEDFQNSLEQIDNACTEVRRISHNMVPASLTKLGLQEAILDLLDNVRASTEIAIEEALDYEEGAYDESKEVLIYRVIQELINNSLKYADPTRLRIALSKSKQEYQLTYEDNGKGFEKSKVKSGLGLRSIASRIDILKGKLTFESAPGQGTTYNITIPHYG